MQKPKLLDRVRNAIQSRRLSRKTETAYIYHIRRFIQFNKERHLKEIGADEAREFLTHLAVNENIAASTRNQASSAISFLYREVLQKKLPALEGVARAKRSTQLPVIFTHAEIKSILTNLKNAPLLVASLIYGSGLRLIEALHLRVKDIDFNMNQITVRDKDGKKDHTTMLPQLIIPKLKRHLVKVERIHKDDLLCGYGEVLLPYAAAGKYPNLSQEWQWQYVFPSAKLSPINEDGKICRLHTVEATIQKAMKKAIQKAGIKKYGSCYTLRHSFAANLLKNHHDVRTVQSLLGHKDIRSTTIYTRIFQRENLVKSPLDV